MACSSILHSSYLTASVLLQFSLLQLAAGAADSTCYFPNGGVHDKGSPCNPNADVSVCCEGTHTCLSNGLCWDLEFNHVIRGMSIFDTNSLTIEANVQNPVSCTDPTFKSALCPQYCLTVNPDQSGGLSGVIGDIRQCSDDNEDWICGMDTAAGCSNSFNLPSGYVQDYRNSTVNNILADGGCPTVGASGTITSTATVFQSTAGAVTTTVLSTFPAQTSGDGAGTNASLPTCSATSKSSLAAGLGAGLGVGLPLLICLGAALFFLRKARRENREWEKRYAKPQVQGTEMQPSTHQTYNQRPEPKYTDSRGSLPAYSHPHQGTQALEAPHGPIYEAPGR